MDIADLFSKEQSCRLLVDPEGKLAEKYRWYREFLVHNHEALQIVSDLERLQQGAEPFTLPAVKRDGHRLLEACSRLVEALHRLSGGRYAELADVCTNLQRQMARLFDERPAYPSDELVLPLEELKPDMVGMAGSKATHLATAGRELGLPVPPGFVVTANAFWAFMEQNDLLEPVDEMLAAVDASNPAELEARAGTVQRSIRDAPVPSAVAQAIRGAYEALEVGTCEGVPLAVRSTAVGEDTEASFAGQYTTVLNVGKEALLDAYKTVLASKYAPRAIRYRARCGLDDKATPMCVAGIVMIDARASGVCYSRDPSGPTSSDVTVSAVWGLGEHLVSGEAAPDTFSLDRETLRITRKEINPKPQRLVLENGGGTRLEETGESAETLPAIDDETARTVARYSLKLEEHFGSPQDVEWCVDRSGRLFVLQSRPLGLSQSRGGETPRIEVDPAKHPVLLSEGKTASRGTASGRVVQAVSLREGKDLEGSILVARTASPDYAKLADSVKGIVTDLGSVASHLASVAREFGIPMIVQAGRATTVLEAGSTVTMSADTATVYDGRVLELEESSSLPGEKVFESPVRRKMSDVLALISPLNLKDPDADTFTPEHCRTVHDVIRFSHEKVVKEMFGLAGQRADGVQSVKMKAGIPLALHFIDLGGGLQENLTTCDEITPDDIASRPMKVLWRGLSHPGISWAGTVGLDSRNLMALMTSGPPPQMASYAVLSDEYVNLSVKFGYHYATIDILWTETPEDNYISLQFGGGAGSFHGRSLRIRFLSEVLEQLGFVLQISGDVVDATVRGYDDPAMEETLDQLGRLLASSRLLDLGIPSQEAVDEMKASFFSGDYNFLQQAHQPLPDFYTPTGNWTRVEENGRIRCLQDGSPSGEGFSCTLKNFMGKMVGSRYQRFLDGIHAYHYFPIAILKESHTGDAWVQARLTLEAGCLDNTGGLLFGLKTMSSFFMLGLDALEGNVSLFEFKGGHRLRHATVERDVQPGESHLLAVRVSEARIEGFLNGEAVIRFDAESPVEGYVGLWTKADSKVFFDELSIQEGDRKRTAAW